MIWQDDFFVSMEGLGEEGAEKLVNMVAKLNCLTEDEGFCYILRRCGRSWNRPCKVKKRGARDWVLENFWDVAYVGL